MFNKLNSFISYQKYKIYFYVYYKDMYKKFKNNNNLDNNNLAILTKYR